MSNYEILFAVLFGIVGAIAACSAATRKGRYFKYWGIAGFFMPPIFLLLWILPSKRPYATISESNRPSFIEWSCAIFLIFFTLGPIALIAQAIPPEQQEGLRAKTKTPLSVNGKWALTSGVLNIPDIKFSFSNRQSLTVTAIVTRQYPASQIIVTVKNQLFPCNLNNVIVIFPHGEEFTLRNMAKNCPQGYALFSSDLDDESAIAKAIESGSQLPIAISTDEADLSLMGKVDPNDFKIFLNGLLHSN